MIKVTITESRAIEIEFEEVSEMETGLVAVTKMLINLSPCISPDSAVITRSQPAASEQKDASTPPKPPADQATEKQKRVERMHRARLLNNQGKPSQTVCMIEALKEIDEPTEPEGIYDYMISHPHINYSTDAMAPLHGIKQALRQKTKLFTDVGGKKYVLTPQALNFSKDAKNVSHKANTDVTEPLALVP